MGQRVQREIESERVHAYRQRSRSEHKSSLKTPIAHEAAEAAKQYEAGEDNGDGNARGVEQKAGFLYQSDFEDDETAKPR